MRRIVVVGSLNMDTVIETSHMPKCGETVVGKNIMQIPGGKGANQAYAIAVMRKGAQTSIPTAEEMR